MPGAAAGHSRSRTSLSPLPGKVGPLVQKRKPRQKRRGFLYRAVSARPDEVLPEFVRRHRQHGASKQVSASRQDGML